MGDHKLRCKAREFQCPLCRRVVPDEQRESHQKTTCPMIESACEHARFGCDVKVHNGRYREHAIEYFPEHVARVAFGEDGVSDFLSAPRDDQTDAVELLKRMQRDREDMLADFASFESMCGKSTHRLSARAEELCAAASRAADDVKEITAAFELQAERERRASAFALQEKLAFDRDEAYNDMLVSRNLAGARVLDEARRLDETVAALRSKATALHADLDVARDAATHRLESTIDARASAVDAIVDAKTEAFARVAAVDAARRSLAARLADARSSIVAVESSSIERLAHRARACETLRAALTARADGVAS